MSIAVFPGSFDPPTFGHLNLIERSCKLFDRVDVVIAMNPDKKYLFSDRERFDMLCKLTERFENVKVQIWSGLIVDYCKKAGAKVLLRGIRNSMDFAYEFDLSLLNHSLNSEIETLFIPTEQKYFLIRSSSIKEVARYDGDVSAMVPEIVCRELKKKFSVK